MALSNIYSPLVYTGSDLAWYIRPGLWENWHERGRCEIELGEYTAEILEEEVLRYRMLTSTYVPRQRLEYTHDMQITGELYSHQHRHACLDLGLWACTI